ncbi:YolD-like family protein [Paenibacillus sp. NPDC056579]|uniref:YolD-like family protein n=1 Tax=unclassified Paenibacillus TaxID=185978 RepID=UPI001EF884AA|nr:YolD-like family protein [Paenibacillus sp. H1-7]ULL18950.1 hypothetical protein DVH26_33660 [Paenibacillus sp. H1-7]
MKPAKWTSEANVIRESSGMMLPEYREENVFYYDQDEKWRKPVLTEEEQQEMFRRLRDSKAKAVEVCVRVYGEHETRNITGIVTGLDNYPGLLDQYLVKIEAKGDWQLFNFSDVIEVLKS